MLLPAFGELQLEAVTTPMIERWIGSIALSASTRTKAIVLLHGIFARARKVWGLPSNPVADVEKPPLSRSGDIDVFSAEEVYARVCHPSQLARRPRASAPAEGKSRSMAAAIVWSRRPGPARPRVDEPTAVVGRGAPWHVFVARPRTRHEITQVLRPGWKTR